MLSSLAMPLDADSLAVVLQQLSLPELHKMAMSSPQNYALVREELRVRHRRMLERFFDNVDGILRLLDERCSVISGSFALNYWTGEKGWSAADVDIYVPFGWFEVVQDYIIKTEGYRRDPEDEIGLAMHLMKRRRRRLRESLPDSDMAVEGAFVLSIVVLKEHPPLCIATDQPDTRYSKMGAREEPTMELSGVSIL